MPAPPRCPETGDGQRDGRFLISIFIVILISESKSRIKIRITIKIKKGADATLNFDARA